MSGPGRRWTLQSGVGRAILSENRRSDRQTQNYRTEAGRMLIHDEHLVLNRTN